MPRPARRRANNRAQHRRIAHRRLGDRAIDLTAYGRLLVEQHGVDAQPAATVAAARPAGPAPTTAKIIALAQPAHRQPIPSIGLPLAMLGLDAHAVAHPPPGRPDDCPAVDRDQTVEAHAHHAVGRPRRVADRRGAAGDDAGGQQCRATESPARAAIGRPSIDKVTVVAAGSGSRRNIEPLGAERRKRCRQCRFAQHRREQQGMIRGQGHAAVDRSR